MVKDESWHKSKALWVVLSLAWIGLVLWFGTFEWPAVHDIGASERGNTEHWHWLGTGLVALGVPFTAYGLVLFLCRRRCGEVATLTATAHRDSGPSRVLLMRHSEKTGAVEDIHLSEAGAKRATELAVYIPKTFGKPDFIFAAARSRRSIRSIETVEPLAAAIGKRVQHDIEDKDFEQLVAQIFSDPKYRGKLIVFCWHHRKLPEIAALLGAPAGSYPKPWPNDVFNLIIDFRYDAGSDTAPVVTRIVEPF